MRRIIKIIIVGSILLTPVFSFFAGAFVANESVRFSVFLDTLQRTVREGLGLPKFWVELQLRDVNGRTRIACPDPDTAVVIVTGGQSNASNSISSLSRTREGDQVFTFYDGACYVTADPVLGPAEGKGGSLWPDFGQRLAGELGRPILFLHSAIGGTQAVDWLDERSGYFASLERRIRQMQEAGYQVDWIMWHQGETDAKVQRVNFQEDLTRLSDKLLATAPAAKMYLFRTSRCDSPGRPGTSPYIRAAQTAVAKANPRIVAGTNTDQFGADFRRDGCHFNSRGRAAVNAVTVPDLANRIRTSSQGG